ncbi:MAG: hypothetical protein GXP47_01910 [Acidobacteria bacterium]|nr:hypothetical protein [Acidobacteriota bacterium]
MTALLATRDRDRGSFHDTERAGHDARHCIVVTRSEDFLFRICFELGAIPEARVTGCVSLFQGWQTAGEDLPQLAVVDATLVDEDPDGVLTLAGCMAPGGTLLVLTDSPVEEMRSKWGTARLVFRSSPKNPGELSAFLRELLLNEGGEEPAPSPGLELEERSSQSSALTL